MQIFVILLSKEENFDLIYLCKVVFAISSSLVKRKRKDQTKNKWKLYKLNQSRILEAALRGQVLKELLQNSSCHLHNADLLSYN